MRGSLSWTILMVMVLAFSAGVVVQTMGLNNSLQDLELRSEEILYESVEREITRQLTDSVNIISNTLATYYQLYRDRLTEEELRQNMIGMVDAARYSDDGYFFMVNMEGVLLTSAGNPQLVGRNIYFIQDQDGVYLVRELIEKARQGGGFVRYSWGNPLTGQSEAKISYARLLQFGPNTMVIGTGAYLPRIAAAQNRLGMEIVQAKKIAFNLTWGGSVVLLAVLSGIGLWMLRRKVIIPIRSLEEGTDEIAMGNFSKRLNVSQQDELGRLAEKFNHMAENLERTGLQRDEAYQSLARSREIFAKAFQYSADTIAITRLSDRKFIEVSNAFFTNLGYSKEEVMGHSSGEFRLWQSPEDYKEAYRELLEEGAIYNREVCFRRKNGELRMGLVSAETVDIDEEPFAVWVWHDITERKAAEEALLESEKRLAQIIDFMPDAILAVDVEGRIIAWNKAIADMTGYSSDRMVGQGDYAYGEAFYGERRSMLVDMVFHRGNSLTEKCTEVLRSGDTLSSEARVEINGCSKVLWMLARPLYDQQGNIVGAIESLRDITERHQAQELLEQRVDERTRDLVALNQELQAINEQLQTALEKNEKIQGQLVQSEKMAALGSLVAGMAHELNTPLGVCMTAASHLEKGTQELEAMFVKAQIRKTELQNYLEISLNAEALLMTNLNRVVNLIRTFKQLSQEIHVSHRHSFRLKAYLNEIVGTWKQDVENQGHQFIIECPDNLEVNSYSDYFGQIITQLVGNSLQHGYEGGVHGNLCLVVKRDEGQLRISYCDDGKGISPEVKDKVFEPFCTTKRSQGAVGLGLHILFNLVTQRLGGQITWENKPEGGVCFHITIPWAQLQ